MLLGTDLRLVFLSFYTDALWVKPGQYLLYSSAIVLCVTYPFLGDMSIALLLLSFYTDALWVKPGQYLLYSIAIVLCVTCPFLGDMSLALLLCVCVCAYVVEASLGPVRCF